MVVDGKLSLITFIPPKNFILIRILFLKKTTNISESDFHVEWTTAIFVFVSSDLAIFIFSDGLDAFLSMAEPCATCERNVVGEKWRCVCRLSGFNVHLLNINS